MMLNWLKQFILNWLGIEKKLRAFSDLCSVSVDHARKTFSQKVQELIASNPPYVIVTGKISAGKEVTVPYSFGIQAEKSSQRQWYYEHMPMRHFTIEKVELFGAGYEIVEIKNGNLSLGGYNFFWPSGKPWPAPKDFSDVNVGCTISVLVNRSPS